ncbi:hypothetical protein [Geobacillus sp. C56-T2]|nr:hypothetical protein [Geobacillus sp. C56-T2]
MIRGYGFAISFLNEKNLVVSVLLFTRFPIDEGNQRFFTGLLGGW